MHYLVLLIVDTQIFFDFSGWKNPHHPKINKYPSIYNQQHKIVHNDTSDLHQHSVNSEWCHNS